MRAVAKGDGYLHPSVSDAVLSDYRRHVTDPLDLLSSREREVLQLIAEGKTKGYRHSFEFECVYGGCS